MILSNNFDKLSDCNYSFHSYIHLTIILFYTLHFAHYMPIGLTFIVPEFKNSPLCSIIPFRNIFQRMLHPSCASVELMNRSCLSNASAREQLGPESSSFTLAYFTKRVMTFREPTVSYSVEAGCLIFFGTVPSTTCPEVCVFPKSIQ